MATIAELVGLQKESNEQGDRVRAEAPDQVLGRDGALRRIAKLAYGQVVHAVGDEIGVYIRKNGAAEIIIHERDVVALDGGRTAFVKPFDSSEEDEEYDEADSNDQPEEK